MKISWCIRNECDYTKYGIHFLCNRKEISRISHAIFAKNNIISSLLKGSFLDGYIDLPGPTHAADGRVSSSFSIPWLQSEAPLLQTRFRQFPLRRRRIPSRQHLCLTLPHPFDGSSEDKTSRIKFSLPLRFLLPNSLLNSLRLLYLSNVILFLIGNWKAMGSHLCYPISCYVKILIKYWMQQRFSANKNDLSLFRRTWDPRCECEKLVKVWKWKDFATWRISSWDTYWVSLASPVNADIRKFSSYFRINFRSTSYEPWKRKGKQLDDKLVLMYILWLSFASDNVGEN